MYGNSLGFPFQYYFNCRDKTLLKNLINKVLDVKLLVSLLYAKV